MAVLEALLILPALVLCYYGLAFADWMGETYRPLVRLIQWFLELLRWHLPAPERATLPDREAGDLARVVLIREAKN